MKKERKTRQPQVVKTAVIAKTALGDSKSKIAKDLNIDRATVRRVLKESEFASFIEQGKSLLIEAIPDAAALYAHKVRHNAEEAKDFLERVTVLAAKAPVSDGSLIISTAHTIRFGDGKSE